MLLTENCLTGQMFSNDERKFQFCLAFQVRGYNVDI
jgi:hypothetical protein